jgi:hypothetical protein
MEALSEILLLGDSACAASVSASVGACAASISAVATSGGGGGGGSGGGGSGGGGGVGGSCADVADVDSSLLVDPKVARKIVKKAKREERKIERKEKQKLAKLYTPEERLAYAEKKKAEARLAGTQKKKLNIEKSKIHSKELVISYDKLTGRFSGFENVKILLELCSKYIVSFVTKSASSVATVGGALTADSVGEASSEIVSKVTFSPKWIELLEMVKFIMPPTKSVSYRLQLMKDGGKTKKVQRIREPSMSTWMSIQLFFALHKLTLKFIAKKPMLLKHVSRVARCICAINHLIVTKNDFSPRLQSFFNLLGVPPTVVISRAHIPVAKAFIGIADRSPIEASVFPTEKPFDGKLKEECGICFLLDSETATCLPCKHVFHTTCIDIWHKNSKTCATCRMAC